MGYAVRIIFYVIFVAIANLVVLIACASQFEPMTLDQAYRRELQSIYGPGSLEAEHPEAERAASLKVRAQQFQNIVGPYLSTSQVSKADQANRMQTFVGEMWGHLPHDWWENRTRPIAIAFLPILYIRLEVFFILMLGSLALHLPAFYTGQYIARKRIREGYHKRNSTVRVCLWVLRFIYIWAPLLIGIVATPPVLFWIPFLILAGVVMTMITATYTIELK